MKPEQINAGKSVMEKLKKRYRILFLDIDNTLLDFDASESESFKKVLISCKMEPEERYVQEYHQINRRCWELFEEGKLEKSQVLVRRFEIFFSRHGREEEGKRAEELYRSFLSQSAILIPGALKLCQDLGKEYRLYAATNGVADTQYRRLEKSGLGPLFSGVFVSEEAGSQKPSREFFDYCFRKIWEEEKKEGIKELSAPKDVLLIGDSLTSDMRGGENAGIDTCWYNPGRLSNDRGVPVTAEVFSYEDIRKMLLKDGTAGKTD